MLLPIACRSHHFAHKHRPTDYGYVLVASLSTVLNEAYHTTKGTCNLKINGIHYIHTKHRG